MPELAPRPSLAPDERAGQRRQLHQIAEDREHARVVDHSREVHRRPLSSKVANAMGPFGASLLPRIIGRGAWAQDIA
eukprot:3390006-Pyramimonas_sp.AAC.1